MPAKKKSPSQKPATTATVSPMAVPPATPLTNRPGPMMRMPRVKKRLTTEEEFKIFTMVLDKILWLGFGIMALGLYELYQQINNPFLLMLAGAALLGTFVFILMREYDIVRN